MASLYDRPDLYDLTAPPEPAMEAFYASTAWKAGDSVLELACGTGRISIPLARAGLEVVGGDISEVMLDVARRRAGGVGVKTEFMTLDMRSFDLGRRFDTVLIAANSLLHLHTAEDFAGLFGSVRRHLTPKGKFVFDIFVPGISILARNPVERHQVMMTMLHRELGEVSLEETTNYQPAAQISRITWYWSTATQKDFWVVPLELRSIFPAELPSLLAAHGFRLVERFGDFDRSPFDDSSWRQVCVAAAT